MNHSRKTDWEQVKLHVGEDGKLRDEWVCYGCIVMCVCHVLIEERRSPPIDEECPYANTLHDPLDDYEDDPDDEYRDY